MSTTVNRVECQIFGQTVQADVVETRTNADAGRGIYDQHVVDTGSGRYVVDEDDVE